MRRLALALGVAAFVAGGRPASAAADTWVSVNGADAGDCAITAPCRTLRYALAQTTAGGTITILTSGRYTPVRITKSVHITAEGVEAVIAGTGPCEATVCVAAGPNDVVSLRGVTILVPGPYVPGTAGISFLNGAALHVEKSAIAGVATFGIAFYPSATGDLYVFDTKIASAVGVEIVAGIGPVRAVFDRSEIHDGQQGVVFQASGVGPIQGVIRNSLITGQTGSSILLFGAVSKNVMLDRSVVASGNTGIEVDGSQSAIRIGDTVFGGFHTSIVSSSSSNVLSYGTNKAVDLIDGIAIGTTVPLR
jgi:hypothetical protein